MKIFGILFFVGNSQIVTPGGKCAPVPVIDDFDPTKYVGEWYEMVRYPVPFQNKQDKCVKVTYGPRDETSITVNNTSIEPERDSDKWYLSWVLGQAEQVRPLAHPNQLYVSFNFNAARASRAPRRSNYDVMDTDYETYTIIMSCVELPAIGSVEYGWILARDQKFRETEMFAKVHQKAIDEFGFKTEKTIQAQQTNCTYDYIKYCNNPNCDRPFE